MARNEWNLTRAVAAAESSAAPCVVGIGASAGGLDALRTFFGCLPASPGFACVVVVHLSPEHESHLGELLQPYTQMPVCQVTRTTALEPNRVYVIPPNANLESIDTHLRLSQLESRRSERAPVDHFLRTLAETHGETAIGVILSGTGCDGALGIRQVRAHGGLTIAQDPREAEYGSMPESAIGSGTVDLVLPLREMAREIIGYCGTRPSVAISDHDGPLDANDASLLEAVLGELRVRTGQDFATYERGILLRRVRRRMRMGRVKTLAMYLEILRGQPDEPLALSNDLLINVTEFFRDSEANRILERLANEALDRKGEQETLRAWVVSCSTGEQAYSLAMLLVEQAARRGESPRVQVFATDLSARRLQQAREGSYPREVVGGISPARLKRFFVEENGFYRVRRELRDLVTFANHDLFHDPPYAHLDLIVCCGLLRQLRSDVRRGPLGLFYYALDPHGVLFLDQDDEVAADGYFIRDGHEGRVLRRCSGPRRELELPPGMRPFAQRSEEHIGGPASAPVLDTAGAFRAATERYLPPSVLINADNQIVHFSSTAARYVSMPGGELTLDIFKLVQQPIAGRLREGLQAMRHGRSSWRSSPFAVAAEARAHRLVVGIDRVEAGAADPELLLVVFDDTAETSLPDTGTGDRAGLKQVLRLEDELARAYAQLADLSMRNAASTESANPVAPGNAELRSVVEELQSAREELQAVNEELISLNDENQYRLEALAQVSNDLQHLLESTGLATLLVDKQLNILRFTPLVSDIFRIKPTDVGRPLADIRHQLRHQNLVAEVWRVLEYLTESELEVSSEDGRWFLLRIQPYRSALRGLEGAVLVLIDMTDRKKAELTLLEADRRKDEFLAVLAHELRNPLAPIGAGIEVLRKRPDDPAVVRQVAATMGRQSQQLVRLVDDLLEVSRISGGKLMLRIAPAQIAEVVRDAVASVRPFFETLQHELTVAVPEEPLVVEGDATRLSQIVGNLLNNAGRYTPSGGKISLLVRRADDKVEIVIRDNGLGIAPKSLPNVFDMFYQAGDPATVHTAGLGIGLTLAKKLVEMHAGTIRAQSPGLNLGSTFTVCLPLARSVRSELSAANQESAPGAETDKQRVLIVDDNSDAAETLRLLMTTIGSGEVRTASNGLEALTVGAQLRPDVVLLDLGMPGMDGYEVARRMRGESWGRHALLVALTGWGQDQHRHRSKEAGFDRHMTKPADPEALRAVLQRVPVH